MENADIQNLLFLKDSIFRAENAFLFVAEKDIRVLLYNFCNSLLAMEAYYIRIVRGVFDKGFCGSKIMFRLKHPIMYKLGKFLIHRGVSLSHLYRGSMKASLFPMIGILL